MSLLLKPTQLCFFFFKAGPKTKEQKIEDVKQLLRAKVIDSEEFRMYLDNIELEFRPESPIKVMPPAPAAQVSTDDEYDSVSSSGRGFPKNYYNESLHGLILIFHKLIDLKKLFRMTMCHCLSW